MQLLLPVPGTTQATLRRGGVGPAAMTRTQPHFVSVMLFVEMQVACFISLSSPFKVLVKEPVTSELQPGTLMSRLDPG